MRAAFAQAPVILVAYSGGYQPAAFALDVGGAGDRVRGVILFDALYSETERFAGWIAQHASTAFFVSAYTRYTQRENARLQQILSEKGIPVETAIPAVPRPGSIAFQLVPPEVEHDDFVTRAWVANPLRTLLSAVAGAGGRAAQGGFAR